MALASNALTSVASLKAYMRKQSPMDADIIAVYHDESDSATAATVEVTGTGIVLIVTGGANAGTDTMAFADSATAATMAAAVVALDDGWVATALGSGGEATADLNVLAQTSAFGTAATQYLQGADSYMMEQAIDAASDQIESHCDRTFASATYTHCFNGSGTPRLVLRQKPVTAVTRVAIGLTEALSVKNTSSDARYATVSNDGTNISLAVKGGANDDSGTPDTVAIGSNTVAQLVTAIIAVGKGWTATSAGSTQDNWPATEIVKFEPVHCFDEDAYLEVPDETLNGYTLKQASGILQREHSGHDMHHQFGHHGDFLGRNFTTPESYHNPGSRYGLHFPKGSFNIYVVYTAGFSTLPAHLKQACNKLAANIIRGGARDGTLAAVSGPGFSESYSEEGAMTAEIKRDLGRLVFGAPPEFIDA